MVMATGGAGEAFKVHVYPGGMTGDGYALAYRAGAELVNMEFIQIGLSSEGQAAVADAGYVPLSDELIRRQLSKLK